MKIKLDIIMGFWICFLGFKKLFGEEGNKDLLIDFLNQVLPEKHQIQELNFRNPENFSDLPFLRKAIFDIHC